MPARPVRLACLLLLLLPAELPGATSVRARAAAAESVTAPGGEARRLARQRDVLALRGRTSGASSSGNRGGGYVDLHRPLSPREIDFLPTYVAPREAQRPAREGYTSPAGR